MVLSLIVHLNLSVFTKTRLNAESTRAGNQKIDLLFRFAAPEFIWFVCTSIVKLTDNDV